VSAVSDDVVEAINLSIEDRFNTLEKVRAVLGCLKTHDVAAQQPIE